MVMEVPKLQHRENHRDHRWRVQGGDGEVASHHQVVHGVSCKLRLSLLLQLGYVTGGENCKRQRVEKGMRALRFRSWSRSSGEFIYGGDELRVYGELCCRWTGGVV